VQNYAKRKKEKKVSLSVSVCVSVRQTIGDCTGCTPDLQDVLPHPVVAAGGVVDVVAEVDVGSGDVDDDDGYCID
jgi:hypothetical protein